MVAPQFTLFPLLPYELRLVIWKFAIQEALITSHPRIHRFATKRSAHQPPYTIPPSTGYPRQPSQTGFTLLTLPLKPVPLFLHLCHDSREAALEKYELWPSGHMLWEPNYVFVNREFDVFYFGPAPSYSADSDSGSFGHYEILDMLECPPLDPDHAPLSYRYGRTAAQLQATQVRRDAIMKRIAGIRLWAFHKEIWCEVRGLSYTMETLNFALTPDDLPVWVRNLVRNTDAEAILVIEDMQFRNSDPEKLTWYLGRATPDMYTQSIAHLNWPMFKKACPDFEHLVDLKLMYLSDKRIEDEITDWEWNLDVRKRKPTEIGEVSRDTTVVSMDIDP
jgi:hypothetical protein